MAETDTTESEGTRPPKKDRPKVQARRLERLERRQEAGKDINEERLAKLRAATGDTSQQAQNIADEWETWNPGGAPVSAAFVQAALDQGYTPKDIAKLFKNQVLGGPQTGPSFSSPELLDYFTANPTEIGDLFAAIESVQGAPRTYADYLEAGGEPGGYRARNQLLQEAVLGIGGAREAYLAGTTRAKAIAAGMNPKLATNARAVAKFLEGGEGETPPESPGLAAVADVFDGLQDSELFSLGDTLQQMMSARQARARAQAFHAPYFTESDFEGVE